MLIHNAEVTGSLRINNVPFNSGSFSGSFRGDGSQLTGVTGASTASYVEYSNVGNKPALVSGSSQITYSGLSGIPAGIVSGSSQVTYSGLTGIPAGIVSGSDQITGFGIFATTGSNQFNGSQAVTGSLTVTGQVVAQTLNVQQVTSSIVYSSGSNIFGNTLGNTQQFTGSVSVTGSLTVNGAGTFAGSVGINGSPGTNFPLEAYINSSTAYSSTSRGNIFRVYNSNTGANIFAGIELGGAGSANDGLAGLNAIVTGNGSAALTFYTRDSNTFAEKMRITSGGNVGIGTTSPQGLLQIGANALSNNSDASNAFNLKQTSTTAATGIYLERSGERKGYYMYIGGSLDGLTFQRNNAGTKADVMSLTRDGNVGIGTDSPITKLSLGDYSGARLPYINGTTNTFSANGITVTSANSGSAAIGGGLDLTNNTYSVGAYSPVISFSSLSSNSAYNNSYAGIWGALVGQGGDANWVVGNLVFGTASSYGITERMRITSDGYLRMASGTGGIQFNGDTAAANALDDYEEGTWTPVIEGSGSNPTITYNTRFGFYTKVGRVVTIHCSIQPLTVSVAGTGNLQFGGLPFTSANLSDCLSIGVSATNGNFSWGTNKTSITFSIGQNTSKIQVYAQQNGTAEAGIPVTNFNNADKYLFFSITYIAS
jgi:hypothetical protein